MTSDHGSTAKFKYHAFISYRHADNKEEGRRWATWLHQALETYEIPDDLVGKKNARGDLIPERVFPIFRDEEELPTDADLGSAITRALDETNFLIVLCSPRAVESKYVADEIDYFKRLGRSDRVMAVILAGEPNASWDLSKRDLGYSAVDECFPMPLQFLYKNSIPTQKRAEPIAADFRIVEEGQSRQGWTNPAQYKAYLQDNDSLSKPEVDTQVKAYEQQLKLMLLKIVAGIIGVSLGELTQRDKAYQLQLARQKATKLRQWLSAVAVLALLAIGAGSLAYLQKIEADTQREIALTNEKIAVENEKVANVQRQLAEKNEQLAQEQTLIAQENQQLAIEQRNEALLNQSYFLLDQAKQHNADGKYDLALLLGLNAIPGLYGGDRPLPDDLTDLKSAILAVNSQYTFQTQEKLKQVLKAKNQNSFLVVTESPQVNLYETSSGLVLKTYKLEGEASFARYSKDSKYLAIVNDDSEIFVFDAESTTLINTISPTERFGFSTNRSGFIAFSYDNETIFTAHYGSISGWNVISNEEVYYKDLGQDLPENIAISADDKLLFYTRGYPIQYEIIALENDELKFTAESQLALYDKTKLPLFSSDGKAFTYFTEKGTFIVNLDTFEIQHTAAHLHYVLGRQGRFFSALPTTPIQGTPEEVVRLEPYRTSPVVYNIEKQGGFQLQHWSDVQYAMFTPNEEHLITRVFKTAHVWNSATGIKVNEVNISLDSTNEWLISEDSNHLIAFDTQTNAIGIYPLLKDEKSVDYPHPLTFYGKTKFSKAGKYLVLDSADDAQPATIYSLIEHQVVHELDSQCEKFDQIHFVSNDTEALVVCRDKALSYLLKLDGNVPEVRPLDVLKHISGYGMQELKVSAKGKFIIASQTNFDGDKVFLSSLDNNTEFTEIELDISEWNHKVFLDHHDKVAAVVLNGRQIYLMDLVSQTLKNKFVQPSYIYNLVFDKNGELFYTLNSDKTVIAYDAESGKQRFELNTNEDISQLMYSAAVNKLLTISADDTLSIWEASTGKLVERGTKELGSNFRLTDDGLYLLNDGTNMQVYDLEKRIVIFEPDNLNYHLVWFYPEDDSFVVVANSGIKVIPAFTTNIEEEAIKKLHPLRRCLTDIERQNFYLPVLYDKEKRARGCL